MKGLFIPDITAEMFRSGCLESIESFMAEGEIYDIEYEPESQWIPCSERLPENYERVLTTISISNREPKVRSGCYHNGLFSNDNGDCWNNTDPEVKGWCKLPEPYKPKDGEIE